MKLEAQESASGTNSMDDSWTQYECDAEHDITVTKCTKELYESTQSMV